jgi:hypothetical protein
MKCALAIRSDGKKVAAVYNDDLNDYLRPSLGAPKVTRASHVRYDDEREIWVATRADDGTVLCESKSRDACVKEEVRILNKEINKFM